MKTVVIWDPSGRGVVKFFVVDRDIGHLDGIYINDSDDIEKMDELDKVYGSADFIYEFPIEEVRGGAGVITCGIIP